jgi:hypothetical protein
MKKARPIEKWAGAATTTTLRVVPVPIALRSTGRRCAGAFLPGEAEEVPGFFVCMSRPQ